jgi:hypothetical protein
LHPQIPKRAKKRNYGGFGGKVRFERSLFFSCGTIVLRFRYDVLIRHFMEALIYHLTDDAADNGGQLSKQAGATGYLVAFFR